MEIFNMSSILIALIPAVASIAAAAIAKSKTEAGIVKLNKKLSKALDNKTSTKYEISELFRQITGIRMNYSDIKEILDDDNCIWLIYFLKKTPGYVKYKEEKLHYAKGFSNSWVRKILRTLDKVSFSLSSL